MGERPDQVQLSHYDDFPEGDKLSDFFSRWSDPGEYFGADTVGCSVLHMAPGEGGPMHAHDAPIEEFYVVLEGSAAMETPEETIPAEEGTIVYFPPGAAHRPVNDSDDPAVVLTYKSLNEDETNNHRLVEE